MQEPQGDDERWDSQHGEAQCQVHLPHSFMLTDIVYNSMDASNPSKGPIMTIRLSNSISRIQTPSNVLGVARLVCQTSLFFRYNFGNAWFSTNYNILPSNHIMWWSGYFRDDAHTYQWASCWQTTCWPTSWLTCWWITYLQTTCWQIACKWTTYQHTIYWPTCWSTCWWITYLQTTCWQITCKWTTYQHTTYWPTCWSTCWWTTCWQATYWGVTYQSNTCWPIIY
jgi:hypothetical protein